LAGQPGQGFQLLIPETLVFHKGRPKVLYFSDRDGYLQARRNALQVQVAEVHQGFLAVRRRRQQDEDEHPGDRPRREDLKKVKDSRMKSRVFKRSMNPKEAKGMKSLGSTSGTEKEKSGLASPVQPALQSTALRAAKPKGAEYARVIYTDGIVKVLSEAELANLAGSRNVTTFAEIRYLQLQAWPLADSTYISYDYDGTKKRAEIDYPKLYGLGEDSARYDKVEVMEKMDARSLVSAVPVLIAQHLSAWRKTEHEPASFHFQWTLNALEARSLKAR
jgi:hypothetical protein